MSGICILGCGEPRVLIADRCGSRLVCDITESMSSLEWGRTMDDTSEAKFKVTVGGTGDQACCECLGNVRSWLHTVVIYRDGELVWGPGPVVNIVYTADEIEVTARDASAWLDVRTSHTNFSFVQQPVSDVVRMLLEDALEPDDPCGLIDLLSIETSTILTDLEVEAGKAYVGDTLRTLARTLLDYTVLGQRIVVAHTLTFGPYTLLTDDHFLTGMQMEERGIETATKWYVNGDPFLGVAGGTPTDTQYLGLIEQIASEDALIDQASADLSAAGRLQASNPPPLYLNIPEGASLSPTAPVCMEQLVPGTLVNVAIQNLCREVRQQMRLTAMSVKYDDTAGEAVGVTLSPVGTNFYDAQKFVTTVGNQT